MYGGHGQKKDSMPGWWKSTEGELVGLVERPETLVKKAEALLGSAIWEEGVVGLALVSGCCLPEVLKTGVMMPKKRYSLLFTAYLEQTDDVLGPFELPTLVEAQKVLEAWQLVRTQVECEEMPAQEICARYRVQVAKCAQKHFARRVPVGEHKDWYAPLHRRIYPLIATRYYCPVKIEPRWFQATVRGLKWPPSFSDENAWRSCCQECMRDCGVYKVGDGENTIDGRQGLKLDQDGVERLECLHEQEEDDRVVPELESCRTIVNTESSCEERQGIQRSELRVGVAEAFKETSAVEEDEEETEEALGDEDDTCEMWILDETRARFDQVMQLLGAQSDDEALVALLGIYDQRRAVKSQVMHELGKELREILASGDGTCSEEETAEEDDERDDQVVNVLLDTYEEHTYAFEMYCYRQMSRLLLPLSESLGTQCHNPLITLHALIRTYKLSQR